MLRMNRQGFTLIELMVVIVIIGVLASLAIPRFTEASAKAKMAEAPGILKSFESAYAAATAEVGDLTGGASALIFSPPTGSKWFAYTVMQNPSQPVEENSGNPKLCKAVARADIGTFKKDSELWTGYMGSGDFKHAVGKEGQVEPTALAAAQKMIPNFVHNPNDMNFEGCKDNEEWGISKPAVTTGDNQTPAEYGCVAVTP